MPNNKGEFIKSIISIPINITKEWDTTEKRKYLKFYCDNKLFKVLEVSMEYEWPEDVTEEYLNKVLKTDKDRYEKYEKSMQDIEKLFKEDK